MKKMNMFLLLATAAVLTGCNTGSSTSPFNRVCDEEFTGYSSLDERTRSTSYRSFLSYMPTSLNSMITMQSSDGEHIANFVDGLVEHDRFGNLVPCLAESYEASPATETKPIYTEWSFNVRQGIKWVDHSGRQYSNEVVKPEDFRFALRIVLNAANNSESFYLPQMIIKGADEFYQATRIYNGYKNLDSEETRLRYVLVDLRKLGFLTVNDTVDTVKDILAFNRVGVRCEGNKVIYTLTQSADYFPTMLTYSPFLPVSEAFYNSIGSRFGSSKDTILYCGAYRLTEWNTTQITYVKNQEYWDKDSVKTETISYTKLPEVVNPNYARMQYEAGIIDGFGITSMDEEGWKKYVLGTDGKGTIQDPHHELTYSQEGQGDKSSFIFYINQNRNPKNLSSTSSIYTQSQLLNANKAFKYSYIRDAILDSLDLRIYNLRNGKTIEEQNQYQINTYTPKYFVSDTQGKDFFDYLVDAYADYHSVTTAVANERLSAGKVNTMSVQDSTAQVNAAIEKLKAADSTITYPIIVEYSGLYFDQDSRTYDEMFIEASNEALNGCIINKDMAVNEDLKVCSSSDIKIQIKNNSKIGSSNIYSEVSNSEQYSLFISGWGPDYGDPLTYANTTVIGGDLAQHFGIYEGATLSDETKTILEDYTAMVSSASNIIDREQRFKAFAEAEIIMLEETGLMRPLYQRGQGWSCTVSKIIPYRSPRAGYGLSSSKMKGLEILKDPLSSCERSVLRDEWKKGM